MRYHILILMTYYLAFQINKIISMNQNPLFLIVSFDGFRYDYIERNLTDFINSLKINASYPPYMMSVFPTKTFPNHFSIATGLYSEVHGVLDNKVFDHLTNNTLRYGYELFHYNDDIVPIWTLNEMTGKDHRSGCMMWPGSDFKYHDILPSHYMSYNVSVKHEDRVDTVFNWFNDPVRPINLGMIYFEQPDLIVHSYGPNSEEVNDKIRHANNVVKYILKKADEAKLLNRLNIIFLSDHGGQAVKIPNNLINLDNFVNKTWYINEGVTPNLQIYPVNGKESEVLAALKGARGQAGGYFTTYTSDEIPEHWHYKHCNRAPPILIIADVGYFFNTRHMTFNTSEIGTHGYDPNEPTMRAFFMALGPAFKHNHLIPPFQNIHIYPLVAHVLGLTLPPLKPNGSLSYLEGILLSSSMNVEDNGSTAYIVTGALFVVLTILAIIGSLIYRHYRQKALLREQTVPSYKVLNQKTDDEILFEAQLSSDCEDISPT